MPSECCDEYKLIQLYQKSSVWCFAFSHTSTFELIPAVATAQPGAVVTIGGEYGHSKAYYCLMMTEYRHQYRLLEFENKLQEDLQAIRSHAVFTAENDVNERHVLRTSGERIELRQPVNVSRLYRSLPDLREEMSEQTLADRV